MTKPKPPPDLAAPGAALWRDTTALFDLTPPEMRLLGEACRTADELARLRAVLVDADAMVAGRPGSRALTRYSMRFAGIGSRWRS